MNWWQESLKKDVWIYSLQNLLFDNITQDKVTEIDSLIREDLRIFFPKIEPVEVSTVGDPDNNTVQFSLRYKITDTDVEDEVTINFLT